MNRKIIITAAVIIIIIIAGIAIYQLTLPTAPTSESPPRARAKIMSDNSYVTNDTGPPFYEVVGEVKNNLKTNIESVNVTATFYDTENNEIGTIYSPTVKKILEPEELSPFIIWLKLNSPTEVPARYDLTLSYVRTNEETIAGLEITNRTSSVNADGYYRVRGEVHNRGERKAYFLKIFCTYYDSDGDVTAISYVYSSSQLDVGEKAAFEISSEPHKISPAAYELLIVTHHYEPIFITNPALLIIIITAFAIFIIYMKRRGW